MIRLAIRINMKLDTTALVVARPTPAAPPRQAGPQGQRIEFQGNLDAQNGQIQEFNNARFNQQRRQAPSKGVQTKQAF